MKGEIYTDGGEILTLFEYSGQSYGDDFPRLNAETVTVIDSVQSGVQCQIRRFGDTLIIAFRGSSSFKDGITDLKFRRCVTPYGNGLSKIKVHCGFLKAYKDKAVRGCIHKCMSDEIKNVKITGHSYGAALAILCAVDLQYNFPKADYEAVVFGCPRVGNEAFKRSYNKRVFKTIRVENGNDGVTKVPFKCMGYRHVGAEFHIGSRRLPFVLSVTDHHAQEYYSRLIEKLGLPSGG